MVATAELLWERVAAVPRLNKIPADELYLKFVYVFSYPSCPEDPNFRRVFKFIYKLSRKIVTRFPADMITEMLVALDPLFYTNPESNKALAKLITMRITSRLKTEDRAVRILFRMYPEEQDMVMHHVTWNATGVITSRDDRGYVLKSDTRYYDLNGNFLPDSFERIVCPVCYGDDPNLQITLPCKHRLHYGCIMEWETPVRGCPICQSPLPQWLRLEADLKNASSFYASSSAPFSFQQLIDKFNSLRKLTFNKLWPFV